VDDEGGAMPGWYRRISGRCKELGMSTFESWMSVPRYAASAGVLELIYSMM
jgi:hypothetical protein